jgi:PAS domain S-box-containing protein
MFNPLEDKQALLNAIIMSSDDAIVSKSLDGIITSWNPAAERMFGYDQKDAVGRHISLIIPEDRLGEEDFIIGQIKAGKKVDHFETIRKTKNNEFLPISVTVSPVVDQSGKIIGASKIARDISDRHKAQQEKAELLEKLKDLNLKKDEFIAIASHELKTPLSSMHAYLQILARKINDEQAKVFVEKAKLQAEKISSLISDILDVSKIEAGKLVIKPEQFNIRQLLEDTIEMVAHTNTDFTITLHTDVDALDMIGDIQRIEQVLVNLLTNAIRYSAGSDKIMVYLDQDGNKVKIGVKDYGLGIESINFDHIFSRFYQIDNVSNVSGLGLGLYLCRQIVSEHQGKIWVESEVKKGSTFWIQLPVVPIAK